jgi:pyruvate dehydrogenase E2 component (dihydrolipoamide acetyltransferase)
VIEITMPKLSDSMEEGTILTWLKADGEKVEDGEDLVELETDKATVTYPAEASGVLRIVAEEGTSLPVGATIARLAVAGQATPNAGLPGPDADVVLTVPIADSGKPPAASTRVDLTAPAATVVTGNGSASPATVRATPLARRVAMAHSVSLADVTGTGPLGRITRGDVLRTADPTHSPAPLASTAAEPAAPPAPGEARRPPATEAVPPKGEVEVVEPTRLQSVIARRMSNAKATVPHFQVQTDVAMDSVIAFRAQLKDAAALVPSFNDLIVKAAGLALRAHPLANGAYRDGHFETYSRVNVGIAVAAEGTLVVPTIFDADQKSLGAIAAETRRVAGAVRDGSVSPAELAGATFTVSNLGMYGMTAITPVVNTPQAAILGVGATREVLARVDGEIVDRHLMTLTLSCDHRILYGAEASQFLSEIRVLLEHPLRLAL